MAGLLDSDDFSERSLADLTSDVVKDAVDDYVATKNLNKKKRSNSFSIKSFSF